MSDAECWLRIGEFSGVKELNRKSGNFRTLRKPYISPPNPHRFIPSLKRGFPIRIAAVPDRTRRYPLQADSELLQC